MPDRARHQGWGAVGSCLLVALMFPLAPRQASAQRPAPPRRAEQAETPRGLALGTGVRASAASSSAVAYNPAALPFGRLYHLEGLAGYSSGEGRWTFGSAVVDSSTQKLAAGLMFRGFIGDGDRGYSGIDGRVALAIPLGRALALGVAGRYLSLTSDAQSPSGGNDTLARGFTVDAALQLQPVEGLSLAGLGYNLANLHSALAPRMAGGSAAYSVGSLLTIGGDLLVDFTTFDTPQILTGGGIEYLAGGEVPLRFGYRFDEGRRLHTLTFGAGYVDQKVGVDLTVTQDVSGGDATEVLAAVRYFIH